MNSFSPICPTKLAPSFQRASGVCRLQLRAQPADARPHSTGVERLFQEGSAKMRLMRQEPNGGSTVALINTAGGLTGGDQFEWRVELDDEAKCTAVTQACDKVYRAEGDAAIVGVTLKLGRGARLDWLPQETILFDGARLYRSFDMQVADGARLLAVEAVLLGRRAMGEHTPSVHLRDRWRVWNGDHLIFADEVRLDESLGAGAALLNEAGAYASLLYVGDDHAERASIVRNLIEACRDHVQGGVSAFGGKLFCRLLARDGFALRKVLIPIMQALRDGEPLPRLWTI